MWLTPALPALLSYLFYTGHCEVGWCYFTLTNKKPRPEVRERPAVPAALLDLSQGVRLRVWPPRTLPPVAPGWGRQLLRLVPTLCPPRASPAPPAWLWAAVLAVDLGQLTPYPLSALAPPSLKLTPTVSSPCQGLGHGVRHQLRTGV